MAAAEEGTPPQAGEVQPLVGPADHVPITVYVQQLTGTQYTVDMGRSGAAAVVTLGDFKRIINEKHGGPTPDGMKLLRNNMDGTPGDAFDEAFDEGDLEDIGIMHGATVHMTVQDEAECRARREAREAEAAEARRVEEAAAAEAQRVEEAAAAEARRVEEAAAAEARRVEEAAAAEAQRVAEKAQMRRNEWSCDELCTLDGDSRLATTLKLLLLAIVFAAMLSVGVMSTQPCEVRCEVYTPDSCHETSSEYFISGRDGGSTNADPCCVPQDLAVYPSRPMLDRVVEVVDACGLKTIIESVVILVLVGVHTTCCMTCECEAFRWVKVASGLVTISVACWLSIHVLGDLFGDLLEVFDDLSEACDGNEDYRKIDG
jgi:hypothetical protein